MKEVKINLERLESVLEKLFLFKSLDEEMKKTFLDESVILIADRSEVIIREGDMEDTVYILIDGEVEVITTRDGREVFLSVLKPNAIIGEISAITLKPRTATVRAVSPCSLIKVRSDLIRRMVKVNPKVKVLLDAISKGREKDTEEKLSDESGAEEEAD